MERWDKTLDSAEVWVLVPKVDGNSDQDFITLYYDDVTDGAVADGQCATCVFGTVQRLRRRLAPEHHAATMPRPNAAMRTATGNDQRTIS